MRKEIKNMFELDDFLMDVQSDELDALNEFYWEVENALDWESLGGEK